MGHEVPLVTVFVADGCSCGTTIRSLGWCHCGAGLCENDAANVVCCHACDLVNRRLILHLALSVRVAGDEPLADFLVGMSSYKPEFENRGGLS
jgi:hypothetical protein